MSAEAEGTRKPAGAQRLDKWLWFARVVKSRTLAAHLVTAGKIRVNKVKAEKPSQLVKTGDVITSAAHKTVRILRVLDTGFRRGPSEEARRLYDELTPPVPAAKAPAVEGHGPATKSIGMSGVGIRPAGSGRPTKRDRRRIDRLTLKTGV
jgi:ribosome-associated heat shock protein Hsp15